MNPRLKSALLGLLLAAAAFAAYLPSLGGGFLWNDSDYVTAPALRGWGGLRRIWFEFGATQQYYPLLHSFFWAEHRLWGDAPAGYRLANLALHVAAALLLGATLRRLFAGAAGPDAPGENAAWLAAFLFALHPVCVESVAWISEQKNTLSAVLYLGAAWAYLGFDRSRSRRAYAGALLLYLLALAAKTSTVTLPAALVVAVWWKRGRLEPRRDLLPIAPWLLPGAAAAAVSSWVERKFVGAEGADFALAGAQRLEVAGRAVWFYLGKLLWPADLCFIYPKWRPAAPGPASALPALGVLALLAGLWLARRRGRAPLAAMLFFVGTLFPVLGFFDFYGSLYSFVADHWQYLPCLGALALAAGAVEAGLRRAPAAGRWAARVALVGALALASRGASRGYRDDETLYRATLERNPDCWLAHFNLGTELKDRGDLARAIPHLERTLDLRPGYFPAEVNLGSALFAAGRTTEALDWCERAVRLQPDSAQAQSNLGFALMAAGRGDEAEACLRRSVQLDPDYASPRLHLGNLLARRGLLPEAAAQFREALRLEPGDQTAEADLAEAEFQWGTQLGRSGRYAEAEAALRESLRLRPGRAGAHRNLGNVLDALGRKDESRAEYREAGRLEAGR